MTKRGVADMKQAGILLGVAVGVPLLLTILFKLLNAVHSLLSRIAVFLLWLVSVAGGVLGLLYLWERRREKKRYGTISEPGE